MIRCRAVAAPVVLIAAALAAAFTVAACGSASPAAVPAEFTITGYTFPTITAAPGSTITIADGDAEPHTVTADDGSFDSGSFDGSAPGKLVVPTTPGSYPIHCAVHPSMHGTLTVR